MVVINAIHNLSFTSSEPKEGWDIIRIVWKLSIYESFTIGINNYYK